MRMVFAMIHLDYFFFVCSLAAAGSLAEGSGGLALCKQQGIAQELVGGALHGADHQGLGLDIGESAENLGRPALFGKRLRSASCISTPGGGCTSVFMFSDEIDRLSTQIINSWANCSRSVFFGDGAVHQPDFDVVVHHRRCENAVAVHEQLLALAFNERDDLVHVKPEIRNQLPIHGLKRLQPTIANSCCLPSIRYLRTLYLSYSFM